MSIQLSALIVAHNEEAMLDDALASVAFCDEIVVVLDKCTDGSKAIAQKHTQHILEGSWELEGERRNLGIEACNGSWILELDADERIPSQLAEEITAFVQRHASTDGYALLPIDNYVGQRCIRYGWAGSFGTTMAKKLFRKGCKWWGMQRVHPQLTLKGQEYRLNNPLIHYVDRDINDMIHRLQRYTDAAAADMRSKVKAGGKMPHFGVTLRKGFTRFYKSYVARKGYKEGRYGFLLALMAMLFPILSHIKAELESHQDGSNA